jgi:cytochrome c peroxidase
LFWDPILSGNRDVACATCHHPQFGYADGLRTAIGTGGHGLGPARTIDPAAPRPTRHAMSVLDTAWNGATVDQPAPRAEDAPMFWDNRAHSLEQQARGPLTAANEMMGASYVEATIFPELVLRLSAIPDYVARFETAFGPSSIDEANILKAIGAFERTLTNPETSYDRYINGDQTALTAQQKRGLQVLTTNGCAKCHSGPMFSDFKLHVLRVPDLPGATHDAGDGSNRFRTASLRNVTLTAPYMHNGVFATFPDVFQFYRNAGQGTNDPDLRGVRPPTPQEAPDVIAFLRALGDAPFDASIPTSVPSGLHPGGS